MRGVFYRIAALGVIVPLLLGCKMSEDAEQYIVTAEFLGVVIGEVKTPYDQRQLGYQAVLNAQKQAQVFSSEQNCWAERWLSIRERARNPNIVLKQQPPVLGSRLPERASKWRVEARVRIEFTCKMDRAAVPAD